MRFSGPQAELVRILITQIRGRAIKARRDARSDLGASAIEWAIISAIVVALALVVWRAVKGVIDSRSEQIEQGG